MTKLTEAVQSCGLCDCEHKTTSITYLEAQQCIDVVKRACIESINKTFKLPEMADITVENARIHDLYRTLSIGAIRDVK